MRIFIYISVHIMTLLKMFQYDYEEPDLRSHHHSSSSSHHHSSSSSSSSSSSISPETAIAICNEVTGSLASTSLDLFLQASNLQTDIVPALVTACGTLTATLG